MLSGTAGQTAFQQKIIQNSLKKKRSNLLFLAAVGERSLEILCFFLKALIYELCQRQRMGQMLGFQKAALTEEKVLVQWFLVIKTRLTNGPHGLCHENQCHFLSRSGIPL